MLTCAFTDVLYLLHQLVSTNCINQSSPRHQYNNSLQLICISNCSLEIMHLHPWDPNSLSAETCAYGLQAACITAQGTVLG